MGVITGDSIKFKSAEFLYSKIKREFKSFGNVNLIDDADFPLYTAEVLKLLGISMYKEEEAVLILKNGKASLPKDFMYLHAAYKCQREQPKMNVSHLQNSSVYYSDITLEILGRSNYCQIDCHTPNQVLEKIEVRQFVKEGVLTFNFVNPILLRLSPNVKSKCTDSCLNMLSTSPYEVSINNGCMQSNFTEGDIYLKYYAFPLDENNMPMIPDIIQVEKAIEWYIKHQLLLNFWLVDDLSNAQNKWQKAEEEYEKAMGEARYIAKLPSFAQMVNTLRNTRGINKVAAFSKMDHNRN